MSETRRSTAKEIMRPTVARLVVGFSVAAGLYQFGCDQFDWPKLPALWGMTGSQFPWWGWFFVALAGFVYALFEYVRRNVGKPPNVATLSDDAEKRLARLEHNHNNLRDQFVAAERARVEQEAHLSQAIGELAASYAALEPLHPHIRCLANMAHEAEAEAYSNRVNEVLAEIERIRKPMPNQKGVRGRLFGLMGDPLHVLHNRVASLGVPEDVLRAEVTRRTDEVKKNARYCILKEEDDDRWNDGDEKQQWHVRDATLDAYRDVANNVSSYRKQTTNGEG